MALVTPAARGIPGLHRLHEAQRSAFLAAPYPSGAERKAHLAALALY